MLYRVCVCVCSVCVCVCIVCVCVYWPGSRGSCRGSVLLLELRGQITLPRWCLHNFQATPRHNWPRHTHMRACTPCACTYTPTRTHIQGNTNTHLDRTAASMRLGWGFQRLCVCVCVNLKRKQTHFFFFKSIYLATLCFFLSVCFREIHLSLVVLYVGQLTNRLLWSDTNTAHMHMRAHTHARFPQEGLRFLSMWWPHVQGWNEGKERKCFFLRGWMPPQFWWTEHVRVHTVGDQ